MNGRDLALDWHLFLALSFSMEPRTKDASQVVFAMARPKSYGAYRRTSSARTWPAIQRQTRAHLSATITKDMTVSQLVADR